MMTCMCNVVAIVLLERAPFLPCILRGILRNIWNMKCVGTTSLHLRHEVDARLHIVVDIGEWIHIFLVLNNGFKRLAVCDINIIYLP